MNSQIIQNILKDHTLKWIWHFITHNKKSSLKLKPYPSEHKKQEYSVTTKKWQHSHKSSDLTANYQPKTLSGNLLIKYYANINDNILITQQDSTKWKTREIENAQFSVILISQEAKLDNRKWEEREMRQAAATQLCHV